MRKLRDAIKVQTKFQFGAEIAAFCHYLSLLSLFFNPLEPPAHSGKATGVVSISLLVLGFCTLLLHSHTLLLLIHRVNDDMVIWLLCASFLRNIIKNTFTIHEGLCSMLYQTTLREI